VGSYCFNNSNIIQTAPSCFSVRTLEWEATTVQSVQGTGFSGAEPSPQLVATCSPKLTLFALLTFITTQGLFTLAPLLGPFQPSPPSRNCLLFCPSKSPEACCICHLLDSCRVPQTWARGEEWCSASCGDAWRKHKEKSACLELQRQPGFLLRVISLWTEHTR